MKVEAIITCVDYADFLAATLPAAAALFDRVLVITSAADRETQELCRKLSTPYYATDVFFEGGGKFDKARGVDFGVGYARWNEWLVQLDADTWLPPLTRHWLESRPLDEDWIYGIDRVDCVGWDAWTAFQAEGYAGHDFLCRTGVPGGGRLPLLPRIAIRDYGGYVPIGFFQLWHGKHGRRYPVARGDAEHTDVLHAIQWGRGKRHLIPEVIGVHLQSAPAPLGSNWKGRRTPRFGPGPLRPFVAAAPPGRGPYDDPRLYLG